MCDHCGCHDVAPIGELDAEHDEILGLAWTVATPADEGGPHGDDSAARLLALLDLHIDKEETGLYPLLRGNDDLGAVQSRRLEQDHTAVREALIAGRFTRTDYYELAAHIDEEDTELFPTALFGFGDDLWDRMATAHRLAEQRARTPRQATPR